MSQPERVGVIFGEDRTKLVNRLAKDSGQTVGELVAKVMEYVDSNNLMEVIMNEQDVE